MKKLKNKLESFKYIASIAWKTVKFRIKVWCRKNFEN